MLGLEPSFPLKYLVYFLIVVCVGGAGTITGPFVAALLVGIVDVAGKYYLPRGRRLPHLRRHDRHAAGCGPTASSRSKGLA